MRFEMKVILRLIIVEYKINSYYFHKSNFDSHILFDSKTINDSEFEVR